MDLSRAMHAATEVPPPTSIDVDTLIARERRRTGNLRALTAVVIVAVVGVAGVAVPQYFAGQPRTQSPAAPIIVSRSPATCVTPSPTGPVVIGGGTPHAEVTESCGAAIARLSDELTTILSQVLPGATLTNSRDHSPMPAKVEKNSHVVAGYSAGIEVDTGQLDGSMSVQIEGSQETPAEYLTFAREQCSYKQPPGTSCRFEERADAVLLIRSYPMDGVAGIDVWAVRADGTRLLVLTRASTAHPAATPVTEAQLIAIATAPELTLYP